MGVLIQQRKYSSLLENEVKPQLHKFNISQLEQSIEAYEVEILASSPKLSSVQTLMKLYQQAAEYYSAIANGQAMAKQIIDRMQGVMSRESIQALLIQGEEDEEQQPAQLEQPSEESGSEYESEEEEDVDSKEPTEEQKH